MRRRDVIALLGGAALARPSVARAQQTERLRRVGVLMNLAETDPEGRARLAAFRQGLQEQRWREGGNLRLDLRWWGAGDTESLRVQAQELVRLAPDVILASGSRAWEALQQETRTLPWAELIERRAGAFDPALEPTLVEMRIAHYWGDEQQRQPHVGSNRIPPKAA